MDVSKINEEDISDEEFGVADTYEDYMPAKLKIGQKHPDAVVETSSLSSVPPTDVWYKLLIPEDIIRLGHLSALQLESITYASQAHTHILPNGCRAGFLIGDGAGVGKGRTIAGIILQNYLEGRKRSIWISVSNDLKYDAERDFRDIGASTIRVHQLNKFKYAKISSAVNNNVKQDVIFSTYAALIGESSLAGSKFKTRLEQLVDWCGEDFDGVIVFDECHRAKNLCPGKSSPSTKTGKTVFELQNLLPKARIVYASATGASEPRNMAYMVRLGLWGEGTPFSDFGKFLQAVERRGVGAKEIVAMDMKLRGMYIARQLSFTGATFTIEEIPLTEDFKLIYDLSVKLWVKATEMFQMALITLRCNSQIASMTWRQFWGAHQRFFKYLCIANKVGRAIEITKEAVKNGKCVVIGLQYTGEARTMDVLEENSGQISEFVSTAKCVFKTLVENHFPTEGLFEMVAGHAVKKRKHVTSCTTINIDYEEVSSEDNNYYENLHTINQYRKRKPKPQTREKTINIAVTCKISESINKASVSNNSNSPSISVNAMKKELLEEIERLGEKLPPNTLDQLIDELGGPEFVAEMTGRRGRIVKTDRGTQYEIRSETNIPLETINLAEKQRFMDGDKLTAIISEAASSGISLQSDRRERNQRKRVHITLELPWSADRAIQQFGRTHRSNQISPPDYIFLISDLAGEWRFASIVAKRLESLGALTHGDRRATQTTNLTRFNIDNKYGRKALEATMSAIMGESMQDIPMVMAPADYKGDFFKDVIEALLNVGLIEKNELIDDLTLPKDCNNITRFLNRILGMPVELQNRLFRYFCDTFDKVIKREKSLGQLDLGILDVGSGNQIVNIVRSIIFIRKHATGTAPVEIHTIRIERGISWTEALDKSYELNGEYEGFWIAYQYGKHVPLLAVSTDTNNNTSEKLFCIYKPNLGLCPGRESLTSLKGNSRKVSAAEAEKLWKEQYERSLNTCSHVFWFGNCTYEAAGQKCEYGLRLKTSQVVCGSVLPVWSRLEKNLVDKNGKRSDRMQVIRFKTKDNVRAVGTLVYKGGVDALINELSKDAEQTIIVQK